MGVIFWDHLEYVIAGTFVFLRISFSKHFCFKTNITTIDYDIICGIRCNNSSTPYNLSILHQYTLFLGTVSTWCSQLLLHHQEKQIFVSQCLFHHKNCTREDLDCQSELQFLCKLDRYIFFLRWCVYLIVLPEKKIDKSSDRLSTVSSFRGLLCNISNAFVISKNFALMSLMLALFLNLSG